MTDTRSLAALQAFPAHCDPVNHIAFAANGELMATSDTAMGVRVWQGREMLGQLDMRSMSDKVRPTERIRGIVFSPDGRRLLVAAGEHVASFRTDSLQSGPDWIYIAPRLLAFLIVSPIAIAVSNDGILAAAFDNGTVVVWGADHARRAIIRHNASPRTLQFLPDGSFIGTDSFSVSLWHPSERQPLWHRPSSERIYGLAASSDGRFVAVRRLYSTIVHDVRSGAAVAEHRQGRGLPLVAFSPTTPCLALGAQHAIHLFEILHNAHAKLSLEEAELVSLAFLPDGSQVLAGCSDGCIRVWDNPLWKDIQEGR
ncbi:MAG TPA: WD40 repeat domain-containing protein [Fimbriimonadaceae bacterium]|nr:WD40 repeat domain-containing protein [Fimbriimonadaceae bacterium]